MTDPSTRLARYRLVERLAELASPAEEQIAYLGQHPNLDLLTGYVEWLATVAPDLTSSGSLSPDALRATEAVRDFL